MSQIRETYSILNNGNIIGKYYGYTPIQAVSKAFSKFCKDKDYNQIINNKFNIYLLARKTNILYLFELERIQLQNPIIRNINNKEIVYNFKNKIKLIQIINDSTQII
jgi:hypothetical protein